MRKIRSSTTQSLIARYNAHEDRLINLFSEHSSLTSIQDWTDEAFIALLLQLGHLSTTFVTWYEQTKLCIRDERAKELIRRILRDEIPRDAPTHQDDRVADLELINVSREKTLCTSATSTTQQTIRSLKRLTSYRADDCDLRLLVTLRIAGEVLVGETYRFIVPQLEHRFGLTAEHSRFYVPHFVHDRKDADQGGHTQAFDALLTEWITDETTLAIAIKAADAAFRVRYAFYNQF